MIRSIGIDPDVHNCAFAQITEYPDGRLDVKAYVVRQKDLTCRDAALALIQSEEFENAVHGVMDERKYPDIVVAEGQDVRYTGKTSYANPQDVCNLALISGAAIACSVADHRYCPLPREWKGTVRKDIKQQRILKSLGIKYEMKGGKKPYPVPLEPEKYSVGKVNQSDWADLVDAIGLAVWGIQKFKATPSP